MGQLMVLALPCLLSPGKRQGKWWHGGSKANGYGYDPILSQLPGLKSTTCEKVSTVNPGPFKLDSQGHNEPCSSNPFWHHQPINQDC